MMVAYTSFIAAIMLLTAFTLASARELHTYGGEVIGIPNRYVVREGDSLVELARAFGLGYNEITDANPGVDPFVPKAGSALRLPLSWVLPAATRAKGIVINLSEMRLYCFPSGATGTVVTFPIGIGDEGSETPIGSYTVTEKQSRPSWMVPMSILRERRDLPARVPPGPDNPLGSHALRLSRGSIMIHGTNKPWGVGRKASHGCIRLYPEDIPELFRLTPKGTRVFIVREPVKIGLKNARVFIEVHGGEDLDYRKEALRLVMARGLLPRIDPAKFFRALREMSGMPEDISLQPARRDLKLSRLPDPAMSCYFFCPMANALTAFSAAASALPAAASDFTAALSDLPAAASALAAMPSTRPVAILASMANFLVSSDAVDNSLVLPSRVVSLDSRTPTLFSSALSLSFSGSSCC